ncbi:MAG: hypothetical protein LBQ31_03980, partial [Bacteroidales bacterium]|nr:hypothetical protein [Bacteroidales bacterium]
QEVKTEFSVTFFLFGNRKWHKNANLVYPDSTSVAQRHQGAIRERKGVFHSGCVGTDTFDHLVG